MPVFWPNGSASIPRVTSEFNAARRNPVTGIVQPHNGIDLVGWADVYSPVDGTVIFAGYNGGAGNEVRIRADGPTVFHVGDVFRLMHHATLYVRTGQRVSARQAIGRMGTTGNSTGVHCHYETHEFRLGNPINPRDFMGRANAGAASGGGAGEGDDMSVEDIFNARNSGDGNRNMLDYGVQIRADLAANQKALLLEIAKIAEAAAEKVHTRTIKRQGRDSLAGQATTLAAMLAWNDEHVLTIIDAVSDGTGGIDVDALAAKLRTALAPEIVKVLGQKLAS